MRSVLTGATTPPAISRREASPEAETTSYSPVRIRVTASSDVPKYFTLALQPVSLSKGVTQSTDLSVLPSSAYPGQARMLTSPSMSPSDSFMGTSGAEKPPPSAGSPPLEPLSVPQPATASARTLTPATAAHVCALIPALLHCVPTRRRASPLLLLPRDLVLRPEPAGLRRPGRRRGRGARTAPRGHRAGHPAGCPRERPRGSARARSGASRRRCPRPCGSTTRGRARPPRDRPWSPDRPRRRRRPRG